ncbi:TetR/AcrR family transcriptional regulator [Rhodococcus ruber]|uniref:TetR/AcrR family transcriptional regulator n=1 Tax=Rhodococcus ruber TaxID=1830 RepID=UPI001E5737F5|nr:TetR/AcrR family transcriptional regulator [Rhodococcus ruber]MCD2129063.1 TetR/AcrR family transcriptional regulator [Rhodococcus ruber]
MGEGTHRRAGRPSTKVLSRQAITDAALDVIEHGGYDAFTVAKLARALGVAPSALYNHVRSKQDVLLWVQEDLMTKATSAGSAPSRGPWRHGAGPCPTGTCSPGTRRWSR